jgi:glycosyltransferase involved in cell wall biosynthesis
MADTCRTSVIYNGVDPGRFMPTSTITPDGQKILSVGNLISIKGHEHLIRAIASLSQEFPSVALDIIGEGPERESLEALARNLQLAGKVNFLGRQSRAQVAEAMRNCNIFALPSRYEGLGCVYIEAMSCAKPAIGCRGQGIAEIIQEGTNGFLVDPENEPELAAILATLLRDPARSRDIGKVARETILGRLTLRHQSVKLMEIYRECLQ